MSQAVKVPTGRLNRVKRDWDFQPGWLRGPSIEIIFNTRLTPQARFLWLWLSSVSEMGGPISWSKCEAVMQCGTKARRSCMAQLIEEGFIKVQKDGNVILNDPYSVYRAKRKEMIDALQEDWEDEDCLLEELGNAEKRVQIKIVEKRLEAAPKPVEVVQEKPEEPRPPKKASIDKDQVIECWNKYRPEGFSKLRTLSSKQYESITKHMRNLSLSPSQTEEFLQAVCAGLGKSNFWTRTVSNKTKCFVSVFGYGNPQDTKMKNVETLYVEGLEPSVSSDPIKPEYDTDQQDALSTLQFIKMQLREAEINQNQPDIETWTKHLESCREDLLSMSIDPDLV